MLWRVLFSQGEKSTMNGSFSSLDRNNQQINQTHCSALHSLKTQQHHISPADCKQAKAQCSRTFNLTCAAAACWHHTVPFSSQGKKHKSSYAKGTHAPLQRSCYSMLAPPNMSITSKQAAQKAMHASPQRSCCSTLAPSNTSGLFWELGLMQRT